MIYLKVAGLASRPMHHVTTGGTKEERGEALSKLLDAAGLELTSFTPWSKHSTTELRALRLPSLSEPQKVL